MHDLRLPLRILELACQQFGYVFEMVDTTTQVLAKVIHHDHHFLAGLGRVGMYPTNPHFAVGLAQDKAWSGQVLRQAGYQTPQGQHFFLTKQWQEYRSPSADELNPRDYAQTLGYPVFVKPNDASSGELAELIFDAQQLARHLQRIAHISPIACIQEYIEWPEYRIFVVDGRVQFLYQRHKPKIVGDGQATVLDLLTDLNRTIPVKNHKVASDSPYLEHQLILRQLTLKSVLPKGAELVVAAHANLAAAGRLTDYQDSMPEEVHTAAATIAQTLGLRVAGIDIFIPPRTAVAAVSKWRIIEVNGNPNLSGIFTAGHTQKALEIWKIILSKYFNKDCYERKTS